MEKKDFDSLTATHDYSRRDFVKTTVGGSFAAAVLPVAAQTITTDTAGLTAGQVTIPVGDFRMPAYRAQPEGKGNLPVILVISEIFGVHEHIADVARRFAKLGYLAIAPELFVRQGDASAYTEISKLLSELISKVPDEQVLGDLDATVAWAKANGGDTSRLGVTGFCWGGRITWLYAAHAPVKAGVAWYGRLVGDKTALQPRHPIDVAGQLNGPVLGLYGGQDTGIPLDTVDKMKAALAAGNAAAKQSEFVIYPDAPHAFHADYRPSYRKDAAEDGWKRCTAWFKTHGVA
ncbi:dienelactone hydrolase family protein [Caldimonas thermodepolymerans]|jgi:carboxymethylenebutenolidase|uniref:Carboxymethylenebutenolidase n=1 Tax=Caldimonas thermodepolymerans TaxID=215580 RepID=A0AA46DGE4_9BURK|nr:dienelactone hydrolase family protein [Caldimonas thermodepolymerans]TCP08748.1 carboxymethylenebutenolidase [Caldimonas thermodepolymerans]UZG43404.1 dienelactone hydrolase family protein [Caldimonas thermodepolymerans]UZG47070.1 dienelactone hydrolase family protein [Caldimonas thermodepolymerans]